MIRLHSDWTYLEHEFGCSIHDRFLMAVRSLDNPKAVTPFLVENGHRRFGMFMHVEKGNVEAARLPPDITPVYYRPYFTFDSAERAEPVYGSLVEAILSIAEGERRVVIDSRAPVAISDELSRDFVVQPDGRSLPATVTAHEAPLAETRARLACHRRKGAEAARKLLVASPFRDRIEPYLHREEERRFEELDRLMDEAGLECLVVSSRLNVQEIAGVPVRSSNPPLAVVYVRGAGSAWVIEAGVGAGQTFASPAELLHQFCPTGKVGLESEDVDVGLYRAFELAEREHAAADRLLRIWRDRNTLPDLPFYILTSRASRHATELALDFANGAIRRGEAITEMDAFSVYLGGLRSFVAQTMPGFRVGRTLTNFHSATRTIFPANPASYPVDKTINTLKIDAGCLLFDVEGFLLGCSDIARTLPMTEAGEEIYSSLRDGVRRVLIPGARAGRTGEDLHELGCAAIWEGRDPLSANPLFVASTAPAQQYDRDVGHLLGKNNLAHLRLARGDRQTLQEGMILCCEYQWPLNGHSIAYEDTCLVTPEGGLNFTIDEE